MGKTKTPRTGGTSGRKRSSAESGRTRVLSFRPNEELANRIAEVVEERYGSASEFLADAAREKLRLIETEEAFKAAKGAWSDEDHPDLSTDKDVSAWVRKLRGHTD